MIMSKGKHLNVSPSPESVQGFPLKNYNVGESLNEADLLELSRYRTEQSRRLRENSSGEKDCFLYDF